MRLMLTKLLDTVEGELQVTVFYLTLLVNRGVHLWLVWLYNAALVVRWYCQKQRLTMAGTGQSRPTCSVPTTKRYDNLCSS